MVVENNNNDYGNTKKKRFLNFILVFILIYFNLGSLAVTVRLSKKIYAIVSFIFFITAFLIHWIYYKHIEINSKFFIVCIIGIGIVMLNMLLNQDYNMLNFVVVSQIITSFMFSTLINFDEFIDNYIKVMLFICIYSLIIMYVIRLFFPFISSYFPLRINEAGLLVRDYIFGFHFENHITSTNRNTGIFREMGVFQIYINLALIFELFIIEKDKKRSLHIIVFIITTVTTLSTPGIIQLFTILLAYCFNIDDKKQLVDIIKVVTILFIIFAVLFFVNPNLEKYIEHSIGKFTGKGYSYKVRRAGITGNLLTWTERPILGHGINNGIKRAEELYLGNFSIHNTSTTTSFMAIYGLVFALIFTMPFIFTFFRMHINLIAKILLIVGFLLSINSQRLIYDHLFYVLNFCCFMETNNTKV